ncbi:MAG TPA: MaoC family dehydratase N-terminal domain-containing protein [Gaiellaceae bacterium]|nr:MaoC family dehydratase N-terminal domain-containing protein [Gaiellaceae bacterium]
MTSERPQVGDASESIAFDVERGAIVRLAEAIGDPHAAYAEGAAAPPTFPTTFNFRLPVPSLRAIDPARFIHGEQEYAYERPLRAGDRITCVARIADVNEKETRLGPATFVVVETEGRDEAGKLVLTGRSTLIVR